MTTTPLNTELQELNAQMTRLGSLVEHALTPVRMLELLHIYAPLVLDALACLVINAQESSIYLVEESQEFPAFWVFCGDCTPSHQESSHIRAILV